MNLQITNHAKTRFRQRGINDQVIDYLIHYGDAKYAPGGAMRISLSKRNANKVIAALKKQIHKIERAQGLVIVQKDSNILTGYHRT
ncbi:DUF4258 domain-containing protein [bacterium]|nr:DUF4258 domain-containing protein [bacterium]